MVYKDLFNNSFAAVLPFSIHADYVYFAMLAFGNYDMLQATGVAVIASTLGMGLNYGIGYYLSGWRTRNWVNVTDTQYEYAARYFSRYLVWLLLIQFLPFINLFTVLAGLLRTRLHIVLLATLIGRVGYYAFYLMDL